MTQTSYFLPNVTDPAPKAFTNGTHRTIDPTETVTRIKRVMPVMGITRIADITGLDTIGLPVVMVVRPNSRSLAVAQGKGLTKAAAQASGLMESVESYHAEQITLPLKLSSYEELRYTHRLLEVARLPFHRGSVFQPTMRLLWICGYDIINDTPTWMPYELVHTDYRLPMPSGSGCFVPSSNGLSGGNHILEAVCHALCEVIERDATSLWNLHSEAEQQATRVDLATIDDPNCRIVLEKYEAAGMMVAIWELTSDIQLPVFKCTIADKEDTAVRRMYSASGMGCHPTRRIALLRALTEAAQSRLTMISGSRDDLMRNHYDRSRNPDVLKNVRDKLASTPNARHFHDAPNFEGETFAEDIAHALECLQKVGIHEVAVVNLTHPLFKIPVARVVIPGLESSDHSPGYLPGQRVRQLLQAKKVGTQ